MKRRKYLLGLSTASMIGIAGCAGSEDSQELDPEVIKSNAEEIPYNDLLRNGDQYEGQAVYFPQAKVAQIRGNEEDGFQMRMNVTEGIVWEDDIFVRWNGGRLVVDDIVEVWGRSNGLYSYETVLGSERTIPDVTAVDMNLLEEA